MPLHHAVQMRSFLAALPQSGPASQAAAKNATSFASLLPQAGVTPPAVDAAPVAASLRTLANTSGGAVFQAAQGTTPSAKDAAPTLPTAASVHGPARHAFSSPNATAQAFTPNTVATAPAVAGSIPVTPLAPDMPPMQVPVAKTPAAGDAGAAPARSSAKAHAGIGSTLPATAPLSSPGPLLTQPQPQTGEAQPAQDEVQPAQYEVQPAPTALASAPALPVQTGAAAIATIARADDRQTASHTAPPGRAVAPIIPAQSASPAADKQATLSPAFPARRAPAPTIPTQATAYAAAARIAPALVLPVAVAAETASLPVLDGRPPVAAAHIVAAVTQEPTAQAAPTEAPAQSVFSPTADAIASAQGLAPARQATPLQTSLVLDAGPGTAARATGQAPPNAAAPSYVQEMPALPLAAPGAPAVQAQQAQGASNTGRAEARATSAPDGPTPAPTTAPMQSPLIQAGHGPAPSAPLPERDDDDGIAPLPDDESANGVRFDAAQAPEASRNSDAPAPRRQAAPAREDDAQTPTHHDTAAPAPASVAPAQAAVGTQAPAEAGAVSATVAIGGTKAPAKSTSPAQASAAATPGAPVAQVAQGLSALHVTGAGARQVTIHLTPGSLGAVQVRIERGVDGTATVTLAAEKAETLHALQQDSAHLHEALDRAGLPSQGRQVSYELAQGQTTGAAGGSGGFAAGQGGSGGSGGGGSNSQRGGPSAQPQAAPAARQEADGPGRVSAFIGRGTAVGASAINITA